MTVNESNTVSLVYQSDSMSCWAAAAVMMLGWRDQVCYADDKEVRARYGDMGGDGTNPDEDLQLALGQGMTVDPAACRLPEGWADLLHRGPVMTTIPGHYVILAGINGDGTPEGTQVQIFDPSAGEHWMAYTEFERLYEADPASITMQY
jgi:ABC-type bacteriocin/lantibiotic exporter with double-glycine peptidase domain